MMTQLASNLMLGAGDTPLAKSKARHKKPPGSEAVGIDTARLRDVAASHDIDRFTTGLLAESLLVLTSVEQKLRDIRRDNDALRAMNEALAQKLADASQHSDEARRLAHHDALTGLPNRRLLIERLQRELATATRQQRQLALLFIDLNDFKAVNDRRGHAVGDKLLTAVAARITNCIRTEDIACRYGGDEFVVLLANLSDAAIAADIGAKIREHLDRRYSIDGHESHVTASVGLAFYPADGEHCDALLSRADALMYRNKSARYRRITLTKFFSGLRQRLLRPLTRSLRAACSTAEPANHR